MSWRSGSGSGSTSTVPGGARKDLGLVVRGARGEGGECSSSCRPGWFLLTSQCARGVRVLRRRSRHSSVSIHELHGVEHEGLQGCSVLVVLVVLLLVLVLVLLPLLLVAGTEHGGVG